MMKNLKNFFLPALTLLISLGLMSGSFAQRAAEAGRFDTVPALKIIKTQDFEGKYLHVLYAVGRHGFINTTPVPYIFTLRASKVAKVMGPEVSFPALQLEKEPFRGSYNMVVVVIADKPTITWANPDANVHVDYVVLKTLEKPTVDLFLSKEGPEATFTISL